MCRRQQADRRSCEQCRDGRSTDRRSDSRSERLGPASGHPQPSSTPCPQIQETVRMTLRMRTKWLRISGPYLEYGGRFPCAESPEGLLRSGPYGVRPVILLYIVSASGHNTEDLLTIALIPVKERFSNTSDHSGPICFYTGK